MTNAVTIYDIAREAGVSASTVSRALSGSHRVSPKTEFRICRIARTLGYLRDDDISSQYDTSGTAASPAGDDIVAIVTPDIINPLYARLITCLRERLGQQRYGVSIITTAGRPFDEREAIRQAMRTATGAILISVQLSERDIRSFALSKPVMLVNRTISRLPSAVLDEEPAIDDALTRLKESGHETLCYLAGPAGSWSSERRRRLIRSLAYAHDMGYRIIRGLPNTIDGGRRAVAGYAANPTDAIMAFNDLMALGFIAEAQRAGMRVPEDVAVIGFDDIAEGAVCSPALASVSVDIDALAREIAEVMINRLRAPESARAELITVPARFIPRESAMSIRRPVMRRSPFMDASQDSGMITLTMLSSDFNEIMPRIEEFERTHPGIVIDPIEGRTQRSTAEFYWSRQARRKAIPDLFNVEYATMPQFAASSCLMDITEQAQDHDWAHLFSPSAWQAAHYAGRLYGIPGDQSQTVMFYRDDLLRKYGLKPPRTWREWHDSGVRLHQRNPQRFMGLLDINDPQHLLALLRMMGARPWTVNAVDRITIHTDDHAGAGALHMVQQCLNHGVLAATSITGTPILPMKNDSFLTLIHANWMGKLLAASYPYDRGRWKVALPPALEEGADPLTAEIGGSLLTISASLPKTKLRAALEFASWFNGSPASVDLRASGGFSATTYFQNKPKQDMPDDPFFEQNINVVYARSTGLVNRQWDDLPFAAHMESTFAEMIVPSLKAGGNLPQAFQRWLMNLAQYAVDQGFQVRVDHNH